jgi:hypothetical protein
VPRGVGACEREEDDLFYGLLAMCTSSMRQASIKILAWDCTVIFRV